MCLSIGIVLTACVGKCQHTYDNPCDADCNLCGEGRTVSHEFLAPDCDDPNRCMYCGISTIQALGHTPAKDDGDCTTDIICEVCGEVVTAGNPFHTAVAVDNDCTAATVCGDCGTELAPAKLSHTPMIDDGDCTTAITCQDCPTVLTEAKASHTPIEDDGDCTTAITCRDCPTVLTEAASDHTPEEDDDDCTTARNCTVCSLVAVEARSAHNDGNADGICDNCPYEFGYVYDASTDTYTVYTAMGLHAAFSVGGNVTLGNDIDIGDTWSYIPAGVTVSLDLAGYTLRGTAIYVIQNDGTFSAKGGVIHGEHFSICANTGTVRFTDDSLTLSGGYEDRIFWNTNNALIDLSGYTGESFSIEAAEDNMTLSNIALPDGWKLYDTNDLDLTATTARDIFVAKEEIVSDGIIDTYEELERALKKGGDITLGADIDIGSNIAFIFYEHPVNLNLAGYTLKASGEAVIHNFGTLTLTGGTVKGTGNYTIHNEGNLTINGGSVSGVDAAIFNAAAGTLTITGGEVSTTGVTTIDNRGIMTLTGGVIRNTEFIAISNFGSLRVMGGEVTTNDTAIDNHGALTLTGGVLTGRSTVDVMGGTTKLIGNNFTITDNQGTHITWRVNDASIDLTEYTGTSLRITPQGAEMSLTSITLPEGWKLYDSTDNVVTTTEAWGTIIAKKAE